MIIKFLRNRRRKAFIERSFKDMPGFSTPSLEDLRVEVLNFEKHIKDYIRSNSGNLTSTNLHNLIHNELPKLPLYPKYKDIWLNFVEEAKALKEYRNIIVHSDFSKEIPPVSVLFDRFNKANDMLRPFRICSGEREKFKPISWIGNSLKIQIDENIYLLSPADINNLQLELSPSSRGKVHFTKGKVVQSKILDYRYEKVTYFIEGFIQFELTHDESMVLSDMLDCLVGQHIFTN